MKLVMNIRGCIRIVIAMDQKGEITAINCFKRGDVDRRMKCHVVAIFFLGKKFQPSVRTLMNIIAKIHLDAAI